MEWDQVMVLDESLKDLSKFILVPPISSPSSSPFKAASNLPKCDGCFSAQLDWLSYGDHYNLWYVALTRAKRVLSVPPKFMKLINDLQGVDDLISLQSLAISGQEEIKSKTLDSIAKVAESSSLTQPLDSLGIIKNESKNTNYDIVPNTVVSNTRDPEHNMSTINPLDEPYIFGGKEWSFEDVRIIHQYIFLPLQAELNSKGGLVIDGRKYFS